MAERPLRLLVAADKFKGSLSGPEACAAIGAGFRDAWGGEAAVSIRLLPVADGGEGMARALSAARNGTWVEETVADPLGRPVVAGFALIDDGRTAVMEMAEASGLGRLGPGERDPWRASTRGTGQLICRALERGVGRLVLGIGGSATNDGGVGLAAELGIVFRDDAGRPVEDLPADLERVRSIDWSGRRPIPGFVVACDVTNPLLGPEGSTRVYGPQKGVAAADFARHEARLRHLVSLAGGRGARAAAVPGSGAAGGLGFGCLVFADAELRPGFDLVADLLGLEAAIGEADLIVTGEGRLDGQTLHGKAPAGVAGLARRLGKPVVAFAGAVEESSRDLLLESFDWIAPIDPGGLPAPEAMRRAADRLRATVAGRAGDIRALLR